MELGLFILPRKKNVNLGSSVGIATPYGLDDRRV
jgi:hypothetical protein